MTEQSWHPSYEELPYPSMPLAATQPDRMATTAALLGCRAASPSTARVLELGCSDAGNLTWLAAYAPDAEFVGVDLSQAAISRGQATSSHLPNVTLLAGDLRDIDLGPFDYVIAHGVYSWLPSPDDLLACIDRHLGPCGIAYVSYNTKPGWYVRDLAGSVMRRAAAGSTDRMSADPMGAALQLRDWLLTLQVDTPHARMLRNSLQLTVKKPGHVLAHDELSGPSHAPFFQDFAEAAAGHDLRYLCESHPGDAELAGVGIPDSLAAGDELGRQQLLDFARNRAFRQTLLVRPGNRPVDHQPDPVALSALWAGVPGELLGADAEGRTRVRVLGGAELTTDSQQLVDDLLMLGAAWPGNLPVAQLGSDPRALLAIYLGHGLELRTAPVAATRPGTRPLVNTHVRERAASAVVASARHDLITLDDVLTRIAVGMCDGTHTRAQIARTLAARATTQASTPAGNLRAALDDLLNGLGQVGLMLG